MKTVGELKYLLSLIKDDGLPIGAIGNFGELLECYDIDKVVVRKSIDDRTLTEAIVFNIQDAGEEPL